MAELPSALEAALDADDAQELNQLLRLRRPEDIQALPSLLTDPSVPNDYRSKALYALGVLGDAAAVPDIVDALPDLDDRSRMSALSALGRLDTPAAVDAVIEHADDPSPQIRKIASLALSRSARPEAQQKLRSIAASDPVDWVRATAERQVDRRPQDGA